MKTNQVVLQSQTVSLSLNNDSTKLASLLALAAGAIAMPQTGSADIIYTDLSGSPVTVNYNSEYRVVIPGAADFRFRGRQSTNTAGLFSTIYRTVYAGKVGPGTSPQVRLAGVAGFAAPLNFGQAWDQGFAMFYNVAVGIRDDLNRRAPSADYDHKYIAWQFEDTTQGNQLRYGWMEIGLTILGFNAGGPNVTIYGYGWDNTGTQPTMGQTPVPEPSAAAIVALGAMALGARGVRSWRQKRDAASVE